MLMNACSCCCLLFFVVVCWLLVGVRPSLCYLFCVVIVVAFLVFGVCGCLVFGQVCRCLFGGHSPVC